jgi:pimeloyl-ACP methyl ester carboxylesterase
VLNSLRLPGDCGGGDERCPITLTVHDLYIQQDQFHDAFAPDLPANVVKVAAAGQRPITDIAFSEAASEPAWKTIPSWFVYGDHDTAIPPKLHAWMANRAHARETIVVQGASHVVMISHAKAVAKVIEDAASAH